MKNTSPPPMTSQSGVLNFLKSMSDLPGANRAGRIHARTATANVVLHGAPVAHGHDAGGGISGSDRGGRAGASGLVIRFSNAPA